MDTNKQESQKPAHRMYCGKSGVRCLVNHMDGICTDVRDCEGCKAEESHEGVETDSPSWAYIVDKVTGAEYISCKGKIGRAQVFKTKKLRENLLIDLDHKGHIIGVEILDQLKH